MPRACRQQCTFARRKKAHRVDFRRRGAPFWRCSPLEPRARPGRFRRRTGIQAIHADRRALRRGRSHGIVPCRQLAPGDGGGIVDHDPVGSGLAHSAGWHSVVLCADGPLFHPVMRRQRPDLGRVWHTDRRLDPRRLRHARLDHRHPVAAGRDQPVHGSPVGASRRQAAVIVGRRGAVTARGAEGGRRNLLGGRRRGRARSAVLGGGRSGRRGRGGARQGRDRLKAGSHGRRALVRSYSLTATQPARPIASGRMMPVRIWRSVTAATPSEPVAPGHVGRLTPESKRWR